MTDREEVPGLRAARTTRGWSQADAARELATLARSRGRPVAATTSLKTLLSRWENGHAVPDAQNRALLVELYGRPSSELGLVAPAAAGATSGGGLAAALASAAAVHDTGLELWWQQLALASRLDDELGAEGAGELVRALVEHLAEVLLHTGDRAARSAVAAVLTGGAALAGAQSLDRVRHEQAWRRYDQARSSAREAELPVAEAVAVAGQAAVLVDVGEATAAVRLLEQSRPPPDGGAQTRVAAALAMARAAAGERRSSREAMAVAERRLHPPRVDIVDRRHGPPVELSDLHRWHGRVLVMLGDAAAAEPLRRALAAGPRSARHRAAVHADLAVALQHERPRDAAGHAGAARQLARVIGSERIAARLSALGSTR